MKECGDNALEIRNIKYVYSYYIYQQSRNITTLILNKNIN